MSSERSIIIGIIVFTLLVMGGISWAFQRQQVKEESIPRFEVTSQQKPEASFEPTEVDLGNITLADVKRADYIITNNGQADLYLYDIKTSCGCTSAVLTINNDKSPTFSMHDNPSWQGIVKPGEQAQVEVIYDAKVHPVDGAVERYVQISTNDPVQEQLQLVIKAFVRS